MVVTPITCGNVRFNPRWKSMERQSPWLKILLSLLLLLFPFQIEAARLFVASNSDKVTPSEGLIQGGSWTFSTWFKLTSLPTTDQYFALFNDGSGLNSPNPLVLYDNPAGTKGLDVYTSSSSGVFNISTYHVN